MTAIQGALDDEFQSYGVQYTADPVTDPADAEGCSTLVPCSGGLQHLAMLLLLVFADTV